jgi:hypothetical protein
MTRYRTAWISLAAMGQLVWTSALYAQSAEAPPAEPSVEAPAVPHGPHPDYPAPQLRKPMTFPSGPVVRLTTDNHAGRLQVMRLKWTDVCVAPCGVPVDPNGLYRIGGGTVRPSVEFHMPRSSGSVGVEAKVGSTVKHWVGIGLIIGGLASVLAGGLFVAASSNVQVSDTTSTARETLKAEGIVYLVGGVILTAIGIPLAISSTSVEVR